MKEVEELEEVEEVEELNDLRERFRLYLSLMRASL